MKKLYLALIFSCLLIIAGCSEKTSDEYVALAEEKVQQNDIPTAIIELKNAIGVNAQDPKSRFMLGKLYAQRGSSAAAEKELILALELGYEPNEVLPILARSYSLQFKNEQIIELVKESRNISPEVNTSLLLYKALAHFQLGEPYKAKKAVADANEISTDSIYSQLGNAYVDFSNKQMASSLEKINEILRLQPDLPDAHLLKGQLTSISKDTQSAVESFEKYKSLLPSTYQSRLFLANAYIKNKQFDKAEQELDLLLQISPEQPFVNQMKGLVRYNKQDFEAAKRYTEKAIQNGMESVANRVVAGVSSFRLHNFEQAFRHIDPIKDQLPANSQIHKLLTILQLNLGLSQEAGQTLADIEGLNEDDIILLSSASAQLIKSGHFEKAKDLVQLAESIEYTNAINLTQKGMLRLSFDELDGITDLESALQLDPELSAGNTALARAYIENGFYDKALALSKVWIEQKPNEVNGYILAAVSQSKKGETLNAEKMYSKALSLVKANPAANIYFADKNEAAGNVDTAIEFLDQVLKAYPYHLSALTKSFVLNKRLGYVDKGLNLIKESVDKNSNNPRLLLLYAQALYSNKQYSQVTKVIDVDTLSVVSDSQIWQTLANAYFKQGMLDKSEDVLKNWRAIQPNNKKAFIRSIHLQELRGENQNALQLVKDASQIFENDVQFKVLSAYFYMKNGQVKEAKSTFNALPKDLADNPIGKGLLGQILLSNNEYERALPLLNEYYQAQPSGKSAMLVAKALKNTDKVGRAFEFLKTHVENYGHSLLTDSQLAELSLLNRNYKEAEKAYRVILQSDPQNVRALNNLASILMLEQRYEEAIPLAKKAAELVPENADILDTYSQLLAKTGRKELAISLAVKAYALNNSSAALSLNVAELLIEGDKNSRAREIIDAITDNAPATVARIKSLRGKL